MFMLGWRVTGNVVGNKHHGKKNAPGERECSWNEQKRGAHTNGQARNNAGTEKQTCLALVVHKSMVAVLWHSLEKCNDSAKMRKRM